MNTAKEILFELAEYQFWYSRTDEGVFYCKFCGNTDWSGTHQRRKNTIWQRSDCPWLKARQKMGLKIISHRAKK